jgi:hypothetical protein
MDQKFGIKFSHIPRFLNYMGKGERGREEGRKDGQA